MPKDFTIDNSQLEELERFYKNKAKKVFNRAGVSVINNLAFEARTENIRSIENSMTIRSPGFVRKSIRVDKAKSTRLDKARAITGSVSVGESTGWAEQELGTRGPSRHSISRNARTGRSNKKKVAAKARLRSNNKFPKWNRWQRKGGGYRHHTKEQATVAMMVDARRGRLKGRFIIDGRNLNGQLGVFKHGLYHRQGKQIVRDQNFEDSARATGRNRWMTRTNNRLDTSYDIDSSWKKAIEFQLNRSMSVKRLKR